MTEEQATLDEEKRAAERALKIAASLEVQRKTYHLSDFLYDTSNDQFWCVPLQQQVSAKSVNAMVPIDRWSVAKSNDPKVKDKLIQPAAEIARIERDQMVEGATWWPGQDPVIEDIFPSADGPMPMPGARSFNRYRPMPEVNLSLAAAGEFWAEHVRKLYPDPVEHNYFFDYCAHMIQKPGQKCNAGIVLSGKHGIGKDAMLLPVRMAVGIWNAKNISPDMLMANFNPWVATLMLTIDEVRPMAEDHKASGMYETLKTLTAAPPTMLPLNEKGMKLNYVMNVLRTFLTTNDRLGMFLPKEDRRFLIMHSKLENKWNEKEDPQYFERFFHRLEERGGYAAVAAWLAARDLKKFNPNVAPPRTEAWQEISESWDTPEDEITQALEMLGNPDVLLQSELASDALLFEGSERIRGMLKSKAFVYRMSREGYVAVPRGDGQKDWQCKRSDGSGMRTKTIYVKESLGLSRSAAREAALDRMRAVADAPKGKIVSPRTGTVKPVKKEAENGGF